MSKLYITRRRVLSAAGLGLLGMSLAPARAQTSQIRILVGFPAGGSTDVVARVLAEGMARILDRPVIVENRPGAGGQIAANALKQAPADGATLLLSNSHALSMIPLTVRQPGYETHRDFAPVGLVAISPDVLVVNPEIVGQVHDLAGLMAWMRAQPKQANIGVPAPASDPEFGVHMLSNHYQLALSPVPYKGDAPIVQDLLAGQIPAGIGSIAVMLQHVKAGRLRIITISGPQRFALLPDVPTYVEQGVKGYGISNFVSALAPAGTPRETIARYNAAIAQVVQSSAFAEKLSELAIQPSSSTPEELQARILATDEAFAAMVKMAGFQKPS